MKLCLNQGKTNGVETERGVRQESCMSTILLNLYGEYLMKEALAEVRDFKIGGREGKVRLVCYMAIRVTLQLMKAAVPAESCVIHLSSSSS